MYGYLGGCMGSWVCVRLGGVGEWVGKWWWVGAVMREVISCLCCETIQISLLFLIFCLTLFLILLLILFLTIICYLFSLSIIWYFSLYLGRADIVFSKRSDALACVTKFHQVELDKAVMHVQLTDINDNAGI